MTMKKKLPLLALAYFIGAACAVASIAAKFYTRASSNGILAENENCKGGIKSPKTS